MVQACGTLGLALSRPCLPCVCPGRASMAGSLPPAWDNVSPPPTGPGTLPTHPDPHEMGRESPDGPRGGVCAVWLCRSLSPSLSPAHPEGRPGKPQTEGCLGYGGRARGASNETVIHVFIHSFDGCLFCPTVCPAPSRHWGSSRAKKVGTLTSGHQWPREAGSQWPG